MSAVDGGCHFRDAEGKAVVLLEKAQRRTHGRLVDGEDVVPASAMREDALVCHVDTEVPAVGTRIAGDASVERGIVTSE